MAGFVCRENETVGTVQIAHPHAQTVLPRAPCAGVYFSGGPGCFPSFSTPCPTALTMIYRLASASSGAMRQSRRFSDIGRRLCCMGHGEATAVRLGNFLFWLFVIIAGAWLLLAHSIGADQDMPAVVYGGAGIALAVGWALRHITRRGLG
jgi:hypothetical protein